jgi:hypothetical protein
MRIYKQTLFFLLTLCLGTVLTESPYEDANCKPIGDITTVPGRFDVTQHPQIITVTLEISPTANDAEMADKILQLQTALGSNPDDCVSPLTLYTESRFSSVEDTLEHAELKSRTWNEVRMDDLAEVTYDNSLIANCESDICAWPFHLSCDMPTNILTSHVMYETDVVAQVEHDVWEIPRFALEVAGAESTGTVVYAVEYENGVRDYFAALRDRLTQSYNTNRAPVAIDLHSSWLTEQVIEEIFAFINYARSLDTSKDKDDMWVLSNEKLVEYMKNPLRTFSMTRLSYCNPGFDDFSFVDFLKSPAGIVVSSLVGITLIAVLIGAAIKVRSGQRKRERFNRALEYGESKW